MLPVRSHFVGVRIALFLTATSENALAVNRQNLADSSR